MTKSSNIGFGNLTNLRPIITTTTTTTKIQRKNTPKTRIIRISEDLYQKLRETELQ